MIHVALSKIVVSAGIRGNGPECGFHIPPNQPVVSTGGETSGKVIKKIKKETKTMEHNENSAITDLASELGVEIEALEERLEMVGIEALACCSINLFCRPSLQ
jgi:hypothetical protein